MKAPVDTVRSGGTVRKLGGLLGFLGFLVPPAGAMRAAGAFGLWNHQNGALRTWGALGWLWLIGLVMLAVWALG